MKMLFLISLLFANASASKTSPKTLEIPLISEQNNEQSLYQQIQNHQQPQDQQQNQPDENKNESAVSKSLTKAGEWISKPQVSIRTQLISAKNNYQRHRNQAFQLNQADANQNECALSQCLKKVGRCIFDNRVMKNTLVNQFILNPYNYNKNKQAIMFSIFGTSLFIGKFLIHNIPHAPETWLNPEYVRLGMMVDSYQTLHWWPTMIWTALTICSDVPQLAIPILLGIFNAYLNFPRSGYSTHATIAIIMETILLPAMMMATRVFTWRNYKRNKNARADADVEEIDEIYKNLKSLGTRGFDNDAISFKAKKKKIVNELKEHLRNESNDQMIKKYITFGENEGREYGIFKTLPGYTKDDIEDMFTKYVKETPLLSRDELLWQKREITYRQQFIRVTKMVEHSDLDTKLTFAFLKKFKVETIRVIGLSMAIWIVLGSGGSFPFKFYAQTPGEGENYTGCYHPETGYWSGYCYLYFLFYVGDRLLIMNFVYGFLYAIGLNAALNMTFMRPWRRNKSEWRDAVPFWREKLAIWIINALSFLIMGGGIWGIALNFTTWEIYKYSDQEREILPTFPLTLLVFFTMELPRLAIAVYGFWFSRHHKVPINTPRKFINFLGEVTQVDQGLSSEKEDN